MNLFAAFGLAPRLSGAADVPAAMIEPLRLDDAQWTKRRSKTL